MNSGDTSEGRDPEILPYAGRSTARRGSRPITIILIALLLVGAPVAGVLLFRTFASAQSNQRPQSLRTVNMTLGNGKFVIEVADTDAEQEIGLMYRDSMPVDHGMIFWFRDEEVRSFWMKNTRIPLDIVYTDKNGKIVAIKQMLPFDLTGVSSDRPAMYAIELNVNVASKAGLKVGDTVKIPDLRPNASTSAPAGTGDPTTAPGAR